MNRFLLNKNCVPIKGIKRGAIYNLNDGEVYSIDELATKIISMCEKGALLNDISNKLSTPLSEIIEYLKELEAAKLGSFTVSQNNFLKTKSSLNKNCDKLNFAWLELIGGCNLRCLHCYANINTIDDKKTKMQIKDWVSVMKQLKNMNCSQIQFIGGEPLLLADDLIYLIEQAKNIGFNFIEVFSNLTLLTDKILNVFIKNKVNVATSFYGPSAVIHNQITQNPESFDKTLANMKKAAKSGIDVRVAVIAMSVNQNYVRDTIEFIKKETGIKKVKYDIVRPAGKGRGSNITPTKLAGKHRLTKPEFQKCYLKDFENRKIGHNCFAKKICIKYDGNVHPCIMERDITYGNVLKSNLKDIVTEKSARKIRLTNKDKIEVCKDCEYRYACFDCRIKAKNSSQNNNFYAKPQECDYNPYLGVWNNQLTKEKGGGCR